MTLKFKEFKVSPTLNAPIEEKPMHYKDRWSYAEYGFNTIGNQAPYFSITGHDAVNDSFGCIHDWISDRFPELRPYIKWHLVAWPGIPMHYVENGCYWLETALGISPYETRAYDPDPFEAFKNTVLLGEVEDDIITWNAIMNEYSWLTETPVNTDWIKKEFRRELKPIIHEWCANRLPALQEKFQQDMFELGVVIDE